MTLGRSFLLWLLGVLILTMVVVSALVLWHQEGVLENELRSRSELLASILALAAAEGGSPEYLTIVSMTDVRAGEVRDGDGRVLWRYGPSLAEIESLDASILRVERRVHVGRGVWGGGDTVDVVLLVSRARVRSNLATAAVRLLTGLGLALGLALVAGLGLIGLVVRPLRELADWVRAFDPEKSSELPVEGGPTAEVRELATAFRDMAARLAEQQSSLVASERRFRELFAASPTPLLLLDLRLAIRGANPAAEIFLGGDPVRSLGRSLGHYVDGLSDDELGAAFSAAREDSETVISARWQLDSGEMAEVELHVRRSGGPGTEVFLAAIHDLTERTRRMGERWRRTFDAMVDGVALVDESGVISLGNRALKPHLEVVEGDLGRSLGDELPREWRTSSAGRLLQCSLSVPEGIEQAILVVRDITDAADNERRLREAEKMQAVGTLASGVAHDFNNLLAAILLHARLIQRQPEAVAEAAAAIQELAEQGTEVVGEMLLFARRESTPPSTVDLVELVRRQEGVFRHLLAENVELVLDLAPEIVPVVGDPVALRRLLLNLVVNARDAVAERGGCISVRVIPTAGRAVLEVVDDGPGIAEEVRERLFEPFFTSRRQGRGSGLGLAVVYGIVTTHGGEVDVRSDPGEGARFIVRLPLGEAAEVVALDEIGAAPAAEARVLLVESDGRAAARTVEVLAGAGLEVRHAPTGEMAARLLERWAPTVVVLADRQAASEDSRRLRELRVPVVVLAQGEGDPAASGRTSVRVESTADPEAVLDALRDLGVVPD
ncbi:MAG: ATP-binding protein [Thermoanaerobaculales bacterium]